MDDELDLDLRRRLRGLAEDRPLPVDLWPAIEARLPATAPASPVRPAWTWAAAAALVMAVAAAWLLPLRNGPDPALQPLVQAEPARSLHADDADTLLRAYDEILAFEAGLPALHWQHQLGRPGGRERLAARRELDASLRELAAALRIEPGSQLLRRLMHQTLGQRVAISRDAWTA
ncbi:hypothetical protein [Pseudofulvimonas gallinarii]|uniref:Uncharacterized protein n=1 Tax=Pseudofulvimonas gallinarii TaxID=634155 RepID=A0A4R3LKW0_9GAMM|nr:hypothetical protein [Pseudofulvimonas gallinarii]TCS99174.1 hypothetical protein EDC25_10612 [Pseudofulvimonas gallinarii]